ncbi:SipW-dependent-type signal peptide-containing protein [Oerskovia enterophila]|uniref:SipW-dependent-type signal peptide-containing protein n=1 Tax=Oerskovia enterophila TaxID=43678 RepID=UPI003822365E
MQESRSRKIKVGLAGLVVLGVGVAATSALWSDNVWFQGDVTSSKFNLVGSLDGTTWLESDDGTNIELTIPTVENLSPGTPVTKTVYVKNDTDSTNPANLAAPVVEVTSTSPELEGALAVTAAYADPAAAANLAPDAQVAITVTYTLTIPAGSSAADNAALQGQTADFTIQVTGTEVVTP